MSTVFSQIIDKKIPSATLYEDDRAYAFLDIGPLRPGHALVIPKDPVAKVCDLSPEDAGHLLVVAQRIMPALLEAVGAKDATLAIHDGKAAGQEVPHVHLHIVPRTPGDGGGPIHALFSKRHAPADGELDALAAKVRAHVEATA